VSAATNEADDRRRVIKQKAPPGPQRSRSIRSYFRQTRLVAVFAIALLAAGIVSDVTNGSFWGRHTLLANIVASALVVLLSVAVINEFIEQRSRKRWRVLAQYVMFELVRNARMFWLGVLEECGLLPTETSQREFIEAGARIVRDTDRLTAAVRTMVGDSDRHARLHKDISYFARHSDEVLGRWAAVMLDAELYAEVIDRHVELAGVIVWIADLLDTKYPPDDVARQWRARSSPAVQIEFAPGVNWLADRIVTTTQLAETLDSDTLELAMHLVPMQWWEDRLGTAAPSPYPDASSSSTPETTAQ
jgi:hypothetical protein